MEVRGNEEERDNESWEWRLGLLPDLVRNMGSVFSRILSFSVMWVFLGPGLFQNLGQVKLGSLKRILSLACPTS